jgi:hypothetical protein
MDKATGKMLNYRQLIRHLAYNPIGLSHLQMNLVTWQMVWLVASKEPTLSVHPQICLSQRP